MGCLVDEFGWVIILLEFSIIIYIIKNKIIIYFPSIADPQSINYWLVSSKIILSFFCGEFGDRNWS